MRHALLSSKTRFAKLTEHFAKLKNFGNALKVEADLAVLVIPDISSINFGKEKIAVKLRWTSIIAICSVFHAGRFGLVIQLFVGKCTF